MRDYNFNEISKSISELTQLFDEQNNLAIVQKMKDIVPEFISNPPDATSLMMSARSFGNYDLAAALSDLIDNSITAQASVIRITCTFGGGQPEVRPDALVGVLAPAERLAQPAVAG